MIEKRMRQMSMPHRIGRLAAFGGWVGVTTVPWYAYKAWRAARNERPAEPGALPIVRVGRDPGPVLAALFAERQPAVVEGLGGASEHLQPAHLREHYGDEVIPDAYASADRDHLFMPGEETRTMTVRELVERIFDEPPGVTRFHGRVRERVLDAYVPPRVDGYDYEPGATALWLSQPEHLTPLHFDFWHGLLTQVRGDKQVTLMPPREVARLGLEVNLLAERTPNAPLTRYPNFHRAIDEGFPALAGTTRFEHRLTPGQTLYVPPYWWHQVVSLEACVSLAARYNARFLEKLHPVALPMLHLHSTMLFRGALTGLRRAWPKGR